MAVDGVHFWVSMLDVLDILNEINALMIKISADHAMGKEHFVALKMIEINEKETLEDNENVLVTRPEVVTRHTNS
ncbi:hypothetical protein PPTG_05206 [Phytophthora nicotianae INRA-310]|uniref:Uncharacterized protein n=1 Tax=Phytophthora nicotianae (strain INRA-310) TaxID=761204 RepID=W2QW92_PHYN3|nr:hypothetical protein PPTG_05206 [Phytophthora nicotianae INRA-310]ETN17393.1 hypothetical protein PPTG_05206 [Phytophthora nicotianae INRA-310]